MTDVNDRVTRRWKEETTSRERVKDVLEETTAYATAGELADRALVSEPTTRKYLNEFVEDGLASAVQDGRTTKYARNEQRVVDRRIEALRTEHTHDELVDGIRRMNEEIRTFRDRYDVDSPEELAISLEPGEDGWEDVGRWRSTRRNLAIAKAALQVDEAYRLAEA